MSFDNLTLERPWRCDVTGNPVGTDTQMVGYTCDCQGCRAADTLAANVKELADAHDRVDVLNETIASYSQVISAKESALAEIRAENERLRKSVRATLTWAEQRCPCRNEEPNPCPLCGASVENLEACKSAENTLPRHILESLRAASRSLGLLDGGS